MEDVEPRIWTRKVAWRQGHILPPDAAEALGLRHPTHPADTCVIVVSHSCDIVCEDLAAEPDVEVIVGRRLPDVDRNFTKTKSPRRLHLPVLDGDQPVSLDLHVLGKTKVPKSELITWRPDPRFSLDAEGLKTLQIWLAIRYRRAAFPHEFDRRMRDVAKLDSRIAKIADTYDPIISAIYFSLDTYEELDEDDATPYGLSVTVMYEPGKEPDASDDLAQQAVAEIKETFKRRCYDQDAKQWRHIRLVSASAISEDDAVVSKVKPLRQRRLDHLSLDPNTGSAESPDF